MSTLNSSNPKNIMFSGKDVLLLIGGKTDSKIMKTIEAFPNGFKGLSDLPEPLFNCTAALVNGHILVVGGKNSEGTNSEFCYKIKCSRANSQHIWKKVDKLLPKPMLGVHCMDISEGIWENSNKPLRIPRWCHATVQIPSLTLSQKIKYFFKSIPGEFRCKSKTNELEQDPESQSFISQP